MIGNYRRWFSTHLPIVGSLFVTDLKSIKEALFELVLSVLFATMPIWFFAFISTVESFVNVEIGRRSVFLFFDIYQKMILKAISNAELLLYVTSVLGPTFYLGLSSFGAKKRVFPWVRTQLLGAIFLGFIASGLFISIRNTPSTSDPFMIWFSIFLYLLALLLLFPAMAFEHERRSFDSNELLREEQEDFQNGYSKHRGGKE